MMNLVVKEYLWNLNMSFKDIQIWKTNIIKQKNTLLFRMLHSHLEDVSVTITDKEK